MSTTYDLKKYGVLYVDDEEQALKYFRKAMDKEFQVLVSTNVADAIKIMEKASPQIGVVLTDQKMPNQTGVELLKRLRQQWPNTVRILITAYSEIENAIEAVNAGAIYKYITKPADLKLLKETVTTAMQMYHEALERETLLRERLDVMQRMVVADRVKSMAAMAGGISHHLRNSMTALTCFLEEMAPGKPGERPAASISNDPAFAEQLWSLALKEREKLIGIVQEVGQTMAQVQYNLSEQVPTAQMVQDAIDAAKTELNGRTITTDLAADLPAVRADGSGVIRLIKTLIAYTSRLSPADGKLSIAARATADAVPSVQITIASNGPQWTEANVASFFTPFAFPESDPSDLGVNLLTAYSIAYQHGGDILVHRAPPQGPGFELLLAVNPAEVRRPDLQDGLAQKVFARAESAVNAPPKQAA